MNLTAYIFGLFAGTQTQYPSDYTSRIFDRFINLSSGEDDILTHRDGDLMYYGYIRKLSGNQSFGICIVLNGIMINTPTILLPIFESIFTDVVMKGDLIRLSGNGELIPATQLFTYKQTQSEKLLNQIIATFRKSKISTSGLPPVSFGIGINESKKLSVHDNISDIAGCTAEYPYTVISRDNAQNTAELNDYISTVKRLSTENESILSKYHQLSKEHDKLKRKKMQFQLVAFLLLGLSVCAAGLFFLYDNLSSAESSLEYAQSRLDIASNTIQYQTQELKEKNDSIFVLRHNYNTEVTIRKKAEDELEQVNNTISSHIPVIITNIEVKNEKRDGTTISPFGSSIYSHNSCYLTPRITYYGFDEKPVTLNVKLYTPNGLSTSGNQNYSYSTSFNCTKGYNTQSLDGWGGNIAGHWPPGRYVFEFWYNNYCVGSYPFRIY